MSLSRTPRVSRIHGGLYYPSKLNVTVDFSPILYM